jgi:hypothetical protein
VLRGGGGSNRARVWGLSGGDRPLPDIDGAGGRMGSSRQTVSEVAGGVTSHP